MRLLYIKLKIITQNSQRHGRENKSRRKENQKCGHTTFSSMFFLCELYSFTKPPSLHHAGRNQSQTGTYLWTLLLPERNSFYSEKKPLNMLNIHHSKAIGFKTEAARLWFGSTLCFDWFPYYTFNFPCCSLNEVLSFSSWTFSLAEEL